MLIFSFFIILLKNSDLIYLPTVNKAKKPIKIKIYLSSKYSKHSQPKICPTIPPKTINFKIFKTGNFLHEYATKTSVTKYKGNKTAIANFGGTANTITGKPKEPRPPPKPDLEIATKKTAKIATGNIM